MENLNFPTLAYWFPFFWIGGAIALSIMVRRRAGKPILTRIPPDAIFAEFRASGHSMRNIITKLGGARGCLQVFVHDQTLTIRPYMPFNLMFIPDFYDLEHVTPLVNITGVKRRDLLIFPAVEVRFVSPKGDERAVYLRMPGVDEFLKAIGREAD